MVRTDDANDRYTIERKLTQGGMAEVYVARKNAPGESERVVMKSLLPSFLDNKDYIAMMVNEARLAAGLSHPNIVRVEDLLEVGGRPFIVMEYLDGQTLRQIVHRAITSERGLSFGLVCRVVAAMLAGLGHAHDRQDDEGRSLGLVHRDVSLANVIVTWTGRVKLIDFGIAKATQMADQELTRAGQLKGKTAYMSPEQVRHEPLDRRSDLFSVGIVLWGMLTRRRLFKGKNEMMSMMAIVSEDAAPPSSQAPGVPAELDRICGKALARDREQRYQTAAEMYQDLEQLMAAQGWTVTNDELCEELACLFPEESPAVVELSVDEEQLDEAQSYPTLYADEDEDEAVTTLAPPQPVPLPVQRPVTAVPLSTLRSTEITLFNQRLPGPSVYDDWVPSTQPIARGHRTLWTVLFACLLAAAIVAGAMFERWNLGIGKSAASVTTGVGQ